MAGNDFKVRTLKAAGWKYSKMTSYGSYPKVATEAFNRIRAALAEGLGAMQLLESLQAPA